MQEKIKSLFRTSRAKKALKKFEDSIAKPKDLEFIYNPICIEVRHKGQIYHVKL